MPDSEIMDSVWEDFIQSDDHMVPLLYGEQVNVASNDFAKKPQFMAGNAVGESRERNKSRSCNVLYRKEADFCSPSGEGSTTEPEGTWPLPLKDIIVTSYDYVDGSTCSADNPILGASNTAYECNSGPFSLTGTSSADGLTFTQHGHNHVENDILCCDLPDIGNFDDIDRIFRNYDSKFGQGSGMLGELSWFSSSSPGIYSPEDNYVPDLQCSNLDKIQPETNPMIPLNDKPANPGMQSSALVDDTDVMGRPLIQEQISTHKQLERLQSFEGMGKEQISDCTTSISSCGSKQVGQFSDQKQKYLASDILVCQNYHSQLADPNHFLLPEASSSTQTFKSREQHGCFLPPHQDLFMPTSSSISSRRDNKSSTSLKSPDVILKEMTEELFSEEYLISAPTVKHQPELLLDTNSVQKQNCKYLKGIRGENEVGNAGLNLPTVTAGFSPLQKNFCMAASFSEDMSNGVILQQLQGIMYQLNVRMKECIRDSLYRLARSAEQRHNFSTNNSSKDSARRALESQDSKRCAVPTSMETQTNPIDRSIAHLLFHRPTEPIFGLPDYTMSRGPYIINEQLGGPIQQLSSNA